MRAHHELEKIIIQDGDREVGNLTPEEAIALANELLDSASKAIVIER